MSPHPSLARTQGRASGSSVDAPGRGGGTAAWSARHTRACGGELLGNAEAPSSERCAGRARVELPWQVGRFV